MIYVSCYHPLIGYKNRISEKTGKLTYSVHSPKSIDYQLMKSYEPEKSILIPCGKCKGCRIDISRKWADRMCLEYDHTKKACFLTLTYDDDHLPRLEDGTPTLKKEDLSKFMKDLRGNKYYEGTEIRFYGVGEYGERTLRPHLHVILFGLSVEDFGNEGVIREFHEPDYFIGRTDHELHYAGQNKLRQPYFRSPHLDNVIWKKGRCCIAEFSWESAAYTARYVRKKLNGPLAEEYGDRQPPFALMSRRPGIAGYFIGDHPEKDFFEEQKFAFGGKFKPIPNYLFDKLESLDPVRYNEIKEKRKKYADDAMMLKLQQTDLSFEELLAVEESHFEAVSTNLKRNLE